MSALSLRFNAMSTLAVAIGFGLLPALAAAQQAPDTRAEACVAISIDAERLACYDAAMALRAQGPEDADAAAIEARETRRTLELTERLERQSLPPATRAKRLLSDIFRSEDGSTALDARIANAGQGSLLDSRWELAQGSKLGVFNLRAYKPVYLLPVFWSNDPNELPSSPSAGNTVTRPQPLDNIEAKFQISFKTKAVENLFGDNGDIWMAYTQSSRWQVYNGEQSRPFRESNYEPEVMLVFRNNYQIAGWHGRMLGIGVNHQSNGREDPFSRSWNRVILNVGLDRDNWAVMLRPWWHISDGSDSDNPDIEDYIGRGDMTIVHTRGRHQFSLMLRHTLRTGEDSRGAARFDWGFPINNTLRGHLQVFSGYGESLIDYNHRATYIGLGISLLEWF